LPSSRTTHTDIQRINRRAPGARYGESFMNRFFSVLCVASVAIGAAAVAQAQTADTSNQQSSPIPTLRCEFKAMSACTPDGDCKEGDQVAGIKVPVKATVDFENSVVAAVDESGFARADKFDGVVESGEQLIIHGVDGPFGWQLIISKASEAASMSFATADVMIGGFGSCTNK
jgi:hypothetical protein